MTRRLSLRASRAGLLIGGLAVTWAGEAAAQDPPQEVRFQFRGTQTDTATRPTRDRPPLDTATSRFEVDGVRVILRRNPASDVVAANLYLLGGTQQLTLSTQGIELMLLAASEGGTASYSKDRLRQVLARSGSSITIAPDRDWTVFGLRTLRPALDSVWRVFTERVMTPKLDSAEVEQVRAELVAEARQRRNQTDAELKAVAESLFFRGHPYALRSEGTPETLSALTREELAEYHAREVVKSRMLLVVVGNVDRSEIAQLLSTTLARLPSGDFTWTPPPRVTASRQIAIIPRTLPTNYILGYYSGPPASSRDYAALRVATAVLAGTLFSEIRSRRNLTYAVDAPFLDDAVATGGLYVTTISPDSALSVMRAELDLMRTELLHSEGLGRLVQRFITDYFLKNETNADQAHFLARAELYQRDFRAADRFVDEVRNVTPDDVRRVARAYMKDFSFVYLGDPKRVQQISFERLR
jgi:zinc protease